jgi:hypothetical protein
VALFSCQIDCRKSSRLLCSSMQRRQSAS